MRNLQNDGMESLPDGIKNPDDLVNELQILEGSDDVTEDEKKVIKKIRENQILNSAYWQDQCIRKLSVVGRRNCKFFTVVTRRAPQ